MISEGLTIMGAVLERSKAEYPFSRSRPLNISSLHLDPPGDREVLVRIEVAGICHSDLSVVNGSRVRPLPMLLGHEAAGIVEQRGRGVDDLAVGTRVVLTFLPRCGNCVACDTHGRAPCLPGSEANGAGTLLSGKIRISRNGLPVHHHLGISAFATHAVVSRNSVVAVDIGVPPEVAALLGCAVLTGGGAILNAAELLPTQSLAVIGLGGVGMAALMVGLGVGSHEVTVIDSQQRKINSALSLGATRGFAPADIPDGFRADVVIEAAGKVSAFEAGLRMTAPGGKLVTVGLPDPAERASLSPLDLVATGKTIMGSYLGSSVPADDIPRYIGMWRDGLLPLENLVSSEVDLKDINEAMDVLSEGKSIRQIIRF